jgi:tRNA A37 N6-isopentenylltransferase MiaA
MGSKDGGFAPRETRMVTVEEEKARIAFALNQAESHLARTAPTPNTRRLRLAIEVYRRTLTSWSALPPQSEKLDRMRDLVAEVLEQARRNSPTLPAARRSG